MPEHQPLIDWMRQQLQQREWTMSDLARRMDVQPSVISRWMRVRRPDPASIYRIADAFGGDPDELLRLAGYRQEDVPVEDAEMQHLIQLLRRVRLTPERYWLLVRMLTSLGGPAQTEYPTPPGRAADEASVRG